MTLFVGSGEQFGRLKEDGSAFCCGDRCTFDHDWKTIEQRVLARFFSETAAAARLVKLARPYLK
jgi:hypothetical protein